MKKFNLTTKLILFITVLISFNACTVNNANLESEFNYTSERVDLKITGDLISNTFIENEELVKYESNLDPLFNKTGCKITVNLGNGDELKIELYNQHSNNPLSDPFQYAAFSADMAEGKWAYVYVDYYTNGELKYSSIKHPIQGYSQLNVVRSKENNNQYLVNIDYLKLFDAGSKHPTTGPAGAHAINSIVIKGTFTLFK